MLVRFDNALITNVRYGVSEKTGKPWGFLHFLDNAGYEWHVFVSEPNLIAAMAVRDVVSLTFELKPDNDGNPRMNLKEEN